MRTLSLALALVGTGLPGLAYAATGAAPGDAVAQSEDSEKDDSQSEDDALKDILGETDGNQSARSETEDVRSGNLGENVGARQEDLLLESESDRKRKVIKTIQRKNFMKMGRFELSPHAAFVANDPFLNRYIVGTGLGYHVTEVFAVEGTVDFAPDLGDGDWKPLTRQLVEENSVSPDISKVTLFGNLSFQYSPIYGKVAIVGRDIILFDVYGAFGMGFARTNDDLEALQLVGDEKAMSTELQTHPTTNMGGGLRIIFGENIAARVEGRSLVYIETVSATTLEMKNNFILQASASWFFPNIKD
jgi:outer membrane beta-barrel protein